MFNRLKTLQSQDIGQISELRSELRVKAYQLDQLTVIHRESERNLESCMRDNDKMRAKNEILNQEVQRLQLTTTQKILQLETDLKRKSSQMEVYEQLENELDNVVLHAGQGMSKCIGFCLKTK